jgi:hypothetical protein
VTLDADPAQGIFPSGIGNERMDAEQNIVSVAESLLPPTEGARRGLGKPYRVGVVVQVIERGLPCVSAEDMVAYVNLVFRIVEDRCTDAEFREDRRSGILGYRTYHLVRSQWVYTNRDAWCPTGRDRHPRQGRD